MAQLLNQDDIANGLSGSNRDWAYNGLDCCITHEVHGVLAAQLSRDPATDRIYRFELACQSPALTMMLRGAAIDEHAAEEAIREALAEEKVLAASCAAIVGDIWDASSQRKGKCKDGKPHAWNNAKNRKETERVDCADRDSVCLKCGVGRLVADAFNPLSAPQTLHLLYDLLKFPKQRSRKGKREITADDEALEKLRNMKNMEERYVRVLDNIIAFRRAHKQIGFLKSRRSSDGRLRQSVNVGATETGRWSASKDPFREGTNFQNIADRSRNIIIADPGLWLFYADLAQAESKIVAFDSQDQAYIDAHESGDVHTFVAKMVWPDLPWTGDPERDRLVADTRTPWDKDHGYRDYAKHVQHGGNIGQTAVGMARDAHIKVKEAEDVYERMYGQAFPGVRARQREIMARVRETGILTTALGRKRQFFGRLWERDTQREGLAQTQQSTVADIINIALRRLWAELDTAPNLLNPPRPSDPNKIWLLAQVHDAILGLIRPHDITTLKRVIELMRVPVLIHGALCTIKVDVQLGTNFRHFDARKPKTVGGLADWEWLPKQKQIRVFNTKEDLK